MLRQQWRSEPDDLPAFNTLPSVQHHVVRSPRSHGTPALLRCRQEPGLTGTRVQLSTAPTLIKGYLCY